MRASRQHTDMNGLRLPNSTSASASDMVTADANASASASSSSESSTWHITPHTEDAIAACTAAVPPLLGLQRLASNAFSLHQVSSAPRLPSAAAPTGGSRAAAPFTASTPQQPPFLLSPHPGTSTGIATRATDTNVTTASSSLSLTPNTSPRMDWPTAVISTKTVSYVGRSTVRAPKDYMPRHREHEQQQQQQQPPLPSPPPMLHLSRTYASSRPSSVRHGIRNASFSAHHRTHPAQCEVIPGAHHRERGGLAATTGMLSINSVTRTADASGTVNAPRHAAPPNWNPNERSTPAQMPPQPPPSQQPLSMPSVLVNGHAVNHTQPPQPAQKQVAWRTVGQPPRPGACGSVTAPLATPMQPLPLSPYAAPDPLAATVLPNTALPPVAPTLPLMTASASLLTPSDGLRALFHQYMEAQRALEPMLRQMQVPPDRVLPLALQESVLEQVQQFAAQMDAAATGPQAPASQPSSSATAWSASRPQIPPSETPGKATATMCAEPERLPCPTPRLAIARKSADVGWDAVLPFFVAPPVGPHATLRAVGPALRRRLEQQAWGWLIGELQANVCPFVAENGAEPHVRDAYARLDGRERVYVGSVPVARRTPLPVPRSHITSADPRLMDGTILLDCERQSLLLDRAWREGWLHRHHCLHQRFLKPHLSSRGGSTGAPHIHVDGVLCDVLRPRRRRPDAGSTASNNASLPGLAWPAGMEEIIANTVPRAGLTPPPPPMLDSRPTTALSVTRKLLGDAVSAISRGRARSADAAATLSRKLNGGHAPPLPPASPVATALPLSCQQAAGPAPDNPSLSSSHLEDSLLNKTAEDGTIHQTLWPLQQLPHQHPYLGHESLPMVVEDLNGTVHVLCSSNTPMEGAEVSSLMQGWLSHHHRLRRQPLYANAAEFLLLGHNKHRGRRTSKVGDEDYEICPLIPTLEELTAQLEAAVASNDQDDGCDHNVGSTSRAALVDVLRNDAQLGLFAGTSALSAPRKSHLRRTNAMERLFRARLQEWRTKRESVVHRMNDVDPPWLMLGNAAGPQPRPLALHLTEQHIPWLARQLCPDSDGGGLLDLQELHLCVSELPMPPDSLQAWQWCLNVFRDRKNLLVLSVVSGAVWPPAASTAEAKSPAWTDLSATRAEDVNTNADSSADAQSVRDNAGALTSTAFVDAVMLVAPLQVLDVHGITAETAAGLLAPVEPEVTLLSSRGISSIRRARLRDMYVSVRRGRAAGAGGTTPRTATLNEVTLSATVFPCLQVLWLDAPRLRHIRFDRLLVLREVHLVGDTSLVLSALRGIEQLPFLEVLHVERAVIDDGSFLGDSYELKELLLHACRLSLSLLTPPADGDNVNADGTVEELRGVERAPKLQTLSLCYTEEIKQLSNFSRCTSLRRVLLTRCNGVSSHSIVGFERLPRLELLALEYTRVSDLSRFAASKSLRVLRADGCKRVLRSSVMGLETAPHLEELFLQDTNVSTVANFGGGCTALRSLDLSGCRHLDVDGLQGIQALPLLEVLSLSHTPISDVDFLADCVELTTLYVEGCTGLLPAALEDLQHAPALRKIVASGCTSIAQVGRLGRCRHLEVLSVAGATALTTAGVLGLERSARLAFLDLSDTSVQSLGWLARGCRELCYLSVKGCPQLTSVRELHGVEELPKLQAFNMEKLRVTGRLDFLTVSASLLYVSFADCTALTADDVRVLSKSDIHLAVP